MIAVPRWIELSRSGLLLGFQQLHQLVLADVEPEGTVGPFQLHDPPLDEGDLLEFSEGSLDEDSVLDPVGEGDVLDVVLGFQLDGK